MASYVGSLKEHSRVVYVVRSQRVLRTIKASVLYVTPLCPECPPKMKIIDEFSPTMLELRALEFRLAHILYPNVRPNLKILVQPENALAGGKRVHKPIDFEAFSTIETCRF